MVPDIFDALVVLDRDGLGVFWFCTAITMLVIASTCSEVIPRGCNVDGVKFEIFGTGLVVDF
jgi:hypothetical protein